MPSCHFVSDGKLAFYGNENFDHADHSRRKIISLGHFFALVLEYVVQQIHLLHCIPHQGGYFEINSFIIDLNSIGRFKRYIRKHILGNLRSLRKNNISVEIQQVIGQFLIFGNGQNPHIQI